MEKPDKRESVPQAVVDICTKLQSGTWIKEQTEANRKAFFGWLGISPSNYPYEMEFFFEETKVSIYEEYMIIKPPFEIGLVVRYIDIVSITNRKVCIESLVETVELRKAEVGDEEFYISKRKKNVLACKATWKCRLALSCKSDFGYMDTFVLQRKTKKISLVLTPTADAPLRCQYNAVSFLCYPKFIDDTDGLWLPLLAGTSAIFIAYKGKPSMVRIKQ